MIIQPVIQIWPELMFVSASFVYRERGGTCEADTHLSQPNRFWRGGTVLGPRVVLIDEMSRSIIDFGELQASELPLRPTGSDSQAVPKGMVAKEGVVWCTYSDSDLSGGLAYGTFTENGGIKWLVAKSDLSSYAFPFVVTTGIIVFDSTLRSMEWADPHETRHIPHLSGLEEGAVLMGPVRHGGVLSVRAGKVPDTIQLELWKGRDEVLAATLAELSLSAIAGCACTTEREVAVVLKNVSIVYRNPVWSVRA